ncbi:MAG: hypothetical protein CL674_00045 [Bdellovibrionaceae bacterium]|nr:hypothetical protein [Pseudobdellovibrionaceae bacterium]|tara:strand:- start:65834 stop:66676 length:843 start_codon:yes stop_codon:yes gene_type:complete
MKKGIFSLGILLALSTNAYGETTVQYCDSAKEYITTLEFLRHGAKGAGKAAEANNRKIAEEVSQNCDGAARRFIKVVLLYQKLNVGMVNAVPVAKQASGVEDERVDMYVSVLRDLYLKSGLDLSLQEAINVAEKYLEPSKVSAKKMKEEFEELTDFCRKDRGLAQTKYACAKLVHEILASMDTEEDEVADAFIDNYKYLRSSKLFFTSYEALKLSRELIGHGPRAIESFHRALKYAMDEKGLNMPKPEALKFATRMAKNSKVESERILKSDTSSSFWSFW